jgi:hypothetical protein
MLRRLAHLADGMRGPDQVQAGLEGTRRHVGAASADDPTDFQGYLERQSSLGIVKVGAEDGPGALKSIEERVAV